MPRFPLVHFPSDDLAYVRRYKCGTFKARCHLQESETCAVHLFPGTFSRMLMGAVSCEALSDTCIQEIKNLGIDARIELPSKRLPGGQN